MGDLRSTMLMHSPKPILPDFFCSLAGTGTEAPVKLASLDIRELSMLLTTWYGSMGVLAASAKVDVIGARQGRLTVTYDYPDHIYPCVHNRSLHRKQERALMGIYF